MIVSNATLQWVPDHLDLLPATRRRSSRRAAGWPSRCRATSTSRATGCSTSWPPTRGSPKRRAGSSGPPRTTQRPTSPSLAELGSPVDAWETTYLHVLDRTRPGVPLDLRHGRPTGAAGAVATSSGPSSRPSTRQLLRDGVPGAAARHGAARSGACSSSPISRRGERERTPDLSATPVPTTSRLCSRCSTRTRSARSPRTSPTSTPYADAMAEIVAATTQHRPGRGARRRDRGDRPGHLAAADDVRRRAGLPDRVGAGRVRRCAAGTRR